jgi:malate dehydrogenase (oxaloacetate-decarboxylating)(NADP+)
LYSRPTPVSDFFQRIIYYARVKAYLTKFACHDLTIGFFFPPPPPSSGYTLLRDPRHNKGLAFSEAERDAHYLRGLLPPALASQELQEKKLMQNLRRYEQPLHRYIAMMDLQERNERLFYKLLIDNVEELLPVVYTPTVGEACQKYGSIYRRPQGLYISLRDK